MPHYSASNFSGDFDFSGDLSKFDVCFDDLEVPFLSMKEQKEKVEKEKGKAQSSSPTKSSSAFSGFSDFGRGLV